MKLIVCTDSRGGMMFNKRRCASDRLISADILREGGGRLLISPYSEKIIKRPIEDELFPSGEALPYRVSGDPLGEAGVDDTVFVEDRNPLPFAEKIQTLIIYNWNIPYPFDVRLELVPEQFGFELTAVTDIPGNSHDIVTKSVYVKRQALEY